MHDETDTIKSLHLEFQSLGGFGPPWSMHVIHWWNAWRSWGYKREDLVLVMKYLQRMVRQGWPAACLSFTNVVKDLDKFAERLAMAKAVQPRRQAPVSAEKVISDQPRAETAAGKQAFEEFRKLKGML